MLLSVLDGNDTSPLPTTDKVGGWRVGYQTCDHMITHTCLSVQGYRLQWSRPSGNTAFLFQDIDCYGDCPCSEEARRAFPRRQINAAPASKYDIPFSTYRGPNHLATLTSTNLSHKHSNGGMPLPRGAVVDERLDGISVLHKPKAY